MNEQIKQIADRLKGLRESLDLNIQDIASVCGISADEYASFESGEKDIPVSVLHNISKKYGVEMTSLLFGEDPHMTSY
ncbi:MAG: helix-turn-helix transcriptional regulator, partial [Paludibacteraceae bacterium]|nr:helix-turn-helix transcriptional regulator [Paludibacteraceae bacterium]